MLQQSLHGLVCSVLGKETQENPRILQFNGTIAGWITSDCTSGKGCKEETEHCVHLGWFHLLHPESKCWLRQNLYPSGIIYIFSAFVVPFPCCVLSREKPIIFFPDLSFSCPECEDTCFVSFIQVQIEKIISPTYTHRWTWLQDPIASL